MKSDMTIKFEAQAHPTLPLKAFSLEGEYYESMSFDANARMSVSIAHSSYDCKSLRISKVIDLVADPMKLCKTL